VHYRLNAIGAISVDPDRKPGAQRLSKLRRKVEEHQIVCVFSQPQFPDAMVRLLIEGTSVRSSRLDDLGSEFQSGPELYFSMMRKLAENLKRCLA
jgi:zinc transport system substrate-binding protein